MAEKRKHERIGVDGKVDGKVILASEIKIRDLSLSGVHFTCTKRVLTNDRCTISLRHQDTTIALNGKVIRSVFKGAKKSMAGNVPVYEVAMEFRELTDNTKETLKHIIDALNT